VSVWNQFHVIEAMESNWTFWLVILSYFVILLLSYLVHKPFLNINQCTGINGTCEVEPEVELDEAMSPIIGNKNATQVIKNRLKVVKQEYDAILMSTEWKVLRTGTNVSVETLEPNNAAKWPLYLKVTC
jgi:hypothetical protein